MEREYIEKKKALRAIISLKLKHVVSKPSFGDACLFNWVCGDIYGIVDGIPAADVKAAESGKWCRASASDKKVVCSNCNSVASLDDALGFQFCPYCGAQMWDEEEIEALERIKAERRKGGEKED